GSRARWVLDLVDDSSTAIEIADQERAVVQVSYLVLRRMLQRHGGRRRAQDRAGGPGVLRWSKDERGQEKRKADQNRAPLRCGQSSAAPAAPSRVHRALQCGLRQMARV